MFCGLEGELAEGAGRGNAWVRGSGSTGGGGAAAAAVPSALQALLPSLH